MNTMSKLQKDYDSLYKKYASLQNDLFDRKEKYRNLQQSYQYLEKTIENKVEKAVDVYCKDLMKENEELKLEVSRLKKLLNQDSNNSGVPTSKTPINKEKRISNSREKSDKTIGGQPGHPKHNLKTFNNDEITDTYIYEATKCSCGSHNLTDKGIKTTKDSLDVDIRVMKIRNVFKKHKCNDCGKEFDVPIPNNLKEENQYGDNVKALAISLVNEGCVSFNRTRKLIQGFTHNQINMSEGYIVKLQKVCSNGLETFINELKQNIIQSPIVHWDDTVIDIDTKRSFLRFYGTEELALYTAHETKGKIGLDEDCILDNLSEDTVVVHDHNKVNYNETYLFDDAECCVHVIRDMTELKEILKHKWFDEMITLLTNTNNLRKVEIEKGNGYFDNVFVEEVMDKYDKILITAKEENKKDYSKHCGNDEKSLIDRLIKYKRNYLMWVIRFDIPFDNNLSERSLRMSKTKQKVSGQFKNIENARYYANIRSYIETCKRNDINEHQAIIKLLNGKPYSIFEILKNED